MKKVELLAPAQNKKSIDAVIPYANAVYFGSDALNMRMNADNIPLSELRSAVSYCHEHNLRAYLTTNVIIYENELKYLENLLASAKNAEIDAVILHDLAAVEIAREMDLSFHISTQASVSNSRAARFYEKLGAERIILARECSLAQIREIGQQLKHTEIETFVHGAQCTSVSGRCYFSAYVYDDPVCSANRGQCLQPCRHKWTLKHFSGAEIDYSEGFFLNSKDLCMIEHIPELIDAGIASFKIEGRMRDPHYIETVARCYCEAIDAVYADKYTPANVESWLGQLKKVYNRGFSTGFYFGRPGPEDISVDVAGNQAETKKVQIGKVIAYYRGVQVAKIVLHTGRLQLGDEIIFEGSKRGGYVHQKIESMQYKTKSITMTPPIPSNGSILLTTKVSQPVKKGDWVYRYLEK
ncbi:MAG: peptidase U32 family protein [Promethearchaeota archaeon]